MPAAGGGGAEAGGPGPEQLAGATWIWPGLRQQHLLQAGLAGVDEDMSRLMATGGVRGA
jgi:hypothetical protein